MKRQNKGEWLRGLFLVVITIMAYQPVWQAGFIWDDNNFLTDNPALKSVAGLSRLWFTSSTPDYYPMTYSMWWLEWRIWANYPMFSHWVNILLHAFSAVLLWRVLQRLKIPGALLAAAIFALHPVNVESVAWITEGKNTLAMFFFAGTLLAWLKFEDSGRGRWYGLALAGFALALLSKTAVAPLPFVLLGIAWWRRGRVGWKDVQRVAPFFVIASVLALVTVWFQYNRAIGHDVIRTDGFWSRLAGAGWAVWFYLYKAVLPLNLVFVYPRWEINPRNVLSYIPLLMLAAAFVLCWRFRRRWGNGLFLGLVYFVLMLLPILGFLNIYFMLYSLVADRWEYFAILGPIVLAAAIIRRPMVAAALLLALGALTWQHCRMFVNDETLWRTTLQRNPDAWIAHNNLGLALLQKGKADEAIAQFQKTLVIKPDSADACYNLGLSFAKQGRLDEAIAQYQKALAIKPDLAEVNNDLGSALLKKGRVEEAMAHYQKALEIKPNLAEARNNLGSVLVQNGRLDEGIVQFQKALQIKPDLADACYNLGGAFLKKGSLDEAIAQYQKTLEINPGFAEAHYNLGSLLQQKGRMDEAIAQYREELAVNANSAEAHNNLGNLLRQKGSAGEAITHFQKALQIDPANPIIQNNLAWLLATCSDAALRNGPKALDLARQASALTGGENPTILHTLAAACAEAGQFGDAVQNAQKAIELTKAAGRQDLVEQLNAELQRYKAGLPWHQ